MNKIYKISSRKRVIKLKVCGESIYRVETFHPNTFNKWFGFNGQGSLTEDEFNRLYGDISNYNEV